MDVTLCFLSGTFNFCKTCFTMKGGSSARGSKKVKHVSLFRHSSPFQAGGGRDPDIIVKNASESKGGVIEKFIKVST